MEVCQRIASNIEKDFNTIYFLFNGLMLKEEDYEKPICEFVSSLNEDVISFIVKDLNKSENAALLDEKKAVIVFWFNGECSEIQCSFKSKLNVILDNFTKNKELQINDLNFYYRQQKINNSSKTFAEIANIVDKNHGKIEIEVKYKNVEFEDKNHIENKSFCKKNKKKILLISLVINIILIIFVIIIVFIVFKKKNNKKEAPKSNPNEIEYDTNYTELIIKNKCNDNCLICDNSTSNKQCLSCKEEFDLYDGECIQYAFYATYQIDNSSNFVNIFNQNKKNSLYVMKINDNIINPISEFKFSNININTIYFYLNDNNLIFL